MKKMILGLSLAACCGTAGAQIDYKVTFKTDKKGVDKVYLSTYKSHEILDSATCVNGQATFTGKTGEPTLAVFSTDKQGKEDMNTFFIDETPTVIVRNEKVKLEEGSTLNRKFFEAKERLNSFNERMRQVELEFRQASQKYGKEIPDTLMQRLQKDYMDAENGQTVATKEVVEENKDNMVAILFIDNCIEPYGVEYVKGFLANYPYKDHKLLKGTREYIAALDRKAPGAMFTDFTMDDMEGTPRKLSDYVGKGNYVLVDFWASWCGPCRAEMPNVKKAYEQFHPKGFEIVGVSFDNNKAAWQKATEQLGISWPQMSDLKGWNCEAGKIYGIRGIPATILFGPDGTVVAADLRGEALQKKLEEIYQ